MENGKEPCFSNRGEAKHFSIFPIPYSISLVSDLLAVSQVANGVVRLADLRGLLLHDRACGRVERGLFQRILESGFGDIFAAFGFRNDRVVILASDR